MVLLLIYNILNVLDYIQQKYAHLINSVYLNLHSQ